MQRKYFLTYTFEKLIFFIAFYFKGKFRSFGHILLFRGKNQYKNVYESIKPYVFLSHFPAKLVRIPFAF